MVLACAAEDPSNLHDAIEGFPDNFEIDIPSFHLIGVSDKVKPKSESISRLFSDAQVAYMPGGHGISRFVEHSEMIKRLSENMNKAANVALLYPPKLTSASDVSSFGIISPYQYVGVELSNLLPEPTILGVLKSKNQTKSLMFNARDSTGSNFTTYGDVVDFIVGGPGDLRRLGVKPGDVVSYGAPPGGGCVPALALLSIMAQATAVPLAPSTTEADALDLLEQFVPKHLILFEGVNNPGVESAFKKIAATGKAALHIATIRSNSKPGFFDYTTSGDKRLDTNWMPGGEPIQNPVDGVALLLGTSGTTSRPKGVPIKYGSIVQNSFILGSSIGLKETDVCYSVMPLFHIGGISASILCSIAAGATICCDGEAYNAENMVDALAVSNPQPTWYSSVPTIHNATVSFIRSMASENEKLRSYGISENGIWKSGHSLRFIRSGAAALFGPDALALSACYGGVPIIPTYSMSEQMPISQPFKGKMDMISDKPGSVGVPVAASLAIVNSATLQPQPFGLEGEIAICGQTIIDSYLNNKEADSKSYFELTLPLESTSPFQRGTFFLTGDVGVLDKEGYLTLKGRNKELIKKGGEQVSPFEIEEPIINHPWIEIAVCFSVPSKIYGEEVGLALILSNEAPTGVAEGDVIKGMKDYLSMREVSPFKWPTKWKIVVDDELPKTKSKKYIRVGLAKHLGFDDLSTGRKDSKACALKPSAPKNNTFIDWSVISGFRFVLACYVMFMHIGSNKSWGAINNLRGWPWHVHVFFTLGGFSLVAPMNPPIPKKFKYFVARFMAMYPMYLVALLFVFANLLVACRPNTFRNTFHWDSQPDDLFIDGKEENGHNVLFCEGTPATPTSYWGSLFLTLVVYLFGFTITPFWVLNWWMGYYFWFSATYYQCLMIFPWMYNKLTAWRGNTKLYLKLGVFLQLLNLSLLLLTWFLVQDYSGYNHYDEYGSRNSVDEHTDGELGNWIGLGWYLFSPFWILYFVIGAVLAFSYDAFRPSERTRHYLWAYIADGITVLMLLWSIVIICQGNVTYDASRVWFLRPDSADNFTDIVIVNRLWDNICGRLFAPITSLWIFSLATGEGYTASILKSSFLQAGAPYAYNCFLFHQPVSQWYYAATRPGLWWNWWQYRKSMYWFSPDPCPVEWYEYFYVVILTVGFSSAMNATTEPAMAALISYIKKLLFDTSEGDKLVIEDALIDAIEDMTGFAPKMDWTLDQCGLSSVGLPQLAARIKNTMSTKTNPIAVSVGQLSNARTVADIVGVIKDAVAQANADGI
eukprot:CAMPEP_0178952316 /NCGR_PEP_ID=MMETSP0789-20121207/7736_1 /TAXON_ID=3005 /ORGANISM="Rhizosolenia setigera, Strain CCMP 1694" /LENGTH=1269 /DNA_ID=CAMNT_0020633331 /DNA_START=617 /DNA_END=4426 /DNA_ORIENTATION=-